MNNKLELSEFLSFSVHRGTEKIAGLRFVRGISTEAETKVSIYIGFPTEKDGEEAHPSS